MSVVKRGNSQNFYVQFRLGGQTVIRSARTTNRRMAEQYEARLRSEFHAQTFLRQLPRLRLDDAFHRYARSKEGTPNHANICGHIRTLLAALAKVEFLDGLVNADINKYLEMRKAEGIAPQTLKHALAVICGTVGFARRHRFRVPDLDLPTIKVVNSKLRYLSIAEEERLLKALDPNRQGSGLCRSHNHEPELRQQLQDLYDLVVLLLDTGARCSEITGLKWSDIDLDTGTIRLWRPKVGNESILFMPVRSRDILVSRKLQATTENVFANKAGGTRNHVHASWRKAFDRAGLLDCTIHTLRHTHASRLIQNGLSLYDVQTVLGHSDPKTTMRYAHLDKAAVCAKARAVIDQLHATATMQLARNSS